MGSALRAPFVRMSVEPPPTQKLEPPTERAAPWAPYVQKIGDFGFDPLNLGTDGNFLRYREAELKHGRIAMLAAVAWPLQEIFHPIIVDALRGTGANTKDMLAASGGASPSLLNGGLFQEELLPAIALFAIGCSVLEETDLRTREQLGCSWNEYPNSFGTFGRQPGNFGF